MAWVWIHLALNEQLDLLVWLKGKARSLLVGDRRTQLNLSGSGSFDEDTKSSEKFVRKIGSSNEVFLETLSHAVMVMATETALPHRHRHMTTIPLRIVDNNETSRTQLPLHVFIVQRSATILMTELCTFTRRAKLQLKSDPVRQHENPKKGDSSWHFNVAAIFQLELCLILKRNGIIIVCCSKHFIAVHLKCAQC